MKAFLILPGVLLLCISALAQDYYNSTVKVHNLTMFTPEPVQEINTELELLTPDEYESHPEYGKLPYNSPGVDYYELIDHRTANTRYYVKKGSYGKEFVTHASYFDLHYPDENGNAITIDTRLKPDPVQPGIYNALHQPNPTALNMDLGYTSIRLMDKTSFKFNQTLSAYSTDNDEQKINLQEINRVSYTVGDNGASINNAFNGIDQHLIFDNSSVKSNYILNDLSSVTPGKKYFVIEDVIILPEGYSIVSDMYEGSLTDDGLWVGELILQNSSGIEMARFATPVVYDNEELSSTSEGGPVAGYKIVQDGNSFHIKTLVKTSWLLSSSRVLPITIDPLVTGTTATWTGISGADNSPTWCSVTLAVPTPAQATLTASSVHWEYVALGGSTCGPTGCRMDDLQVQINTSCGWSPSSTLVWVCSPGCNSAGTWIPTVNDATTTALVSCFTPQCASFNINFTLYFNQFSCTTPGGCVTTCAYMSRIDIYIQGRTVEAAALAGSSSVPSYTIPDCTAQYLTLNASPTYGVPSYTYLWTPGSVTTSGYFITPPPSSTTVYTLTVTDACGNTATDNITIVNPCLTLPVDLASFTGFENNNMHYLHWTTLSEENVLSFDIERSVNGESFERLGTVKAEGEAHSYAFTDISPVSGINYYRLQVIDADNTSEYSQIISISSGIIPGDLSIDVSSTITSLQFNINSPMAGTAQVILYDVAGKEIFTQNISVGEGRTEALVNADNLAAGTYLAVLQMNSELANAKFVRQ